MREITKDMTGRFSPDDFIKPIQNNGPNIEALSREFCELTGMKWHEMEFRAGAIVAVCSCGEEFRWLPFAYEHERTANTDLTDAREVLKVMRKRADFVKFMQENFKEDYEYDIYYFLGYILDTTGLLLRGAVDFLKEVKADEMPAQR